MTSIRTLALLLLAAGSWQPVAGIWQPAATQSHLLVVSGLGGEARWSEEFHRWGTALVDAAGARYGMGGEQIVWLAERPERDAERIDGRATREEVERAIVAMAGRAGPADRVLVVLIGHGSSDAQGARLNLPGPDLTATELATMLDRFPTQRVAVVNTASASGDFQEPLAGRNRTVITATRSGSERNETVFGRFFVAALAGDGADADKDGRVTVLEAFDFATREVERHYADAGHLQSEHAVLGGDREAARAFHLAGGAAATVANSAEARALVEQRQEIQRRVEVLRGRKESMDETQYRTELEALLVELAVKTREIRALEGK